MLGWKYPPGSRGLGWVLLADKILQDIQSFGILNDGNYCMRRTMDNPGFCPSAVCWLRVDGCGGSLQDSRDFQISGSLEASSFCRGLSVLGAILEGSWDLVSQVISRL